MDTLHERVGPSERARNPLPVLNDFHHDPPGMASPNHRTLSDEFLAQAGGQKFRTVVADPPWQFQNKTGKVAPEHRRLTRYATMTLEEICALPVAQVTAEPAHLYLWVPNALLPDGLRVMAEWGFQYKSNIVWHKIRKDGGSDGRGVGFYFRNVTELILFGVRGKKARTLAPGRSQVNMIESRKREHSRKPDEQYELIERCSPGPYLELFSRGTRKGWTVWGNQANEGYRPTWQTYKYNSSNEAGLLQLSA
jgi:N6-adenosine-specific RNA methylase IME4